MKPASTRAMLNQAKCVALMRVARTALAVRAIPARDRAPTRQASRRSAGRSLHRPAVALQEASEGIHSVQRREDGKDDDGDEKKDITFTVER